MKGKVEIDIVGKAFTFIYEDETEEQAKNRLMGALLKGEISVNEDPRYRLHLFIKETEQEGK